MENWYVSIYHWGGFLEKHYHGQNEIPIHFTLNGKKYNVLKYYVAWKEIVEAYNEGKLEPTVEIVRRWKKHYKKQCQGEINFRNVNTRIKQLEKKILEKEKLLEAYMKADQDLKNEIKRSKKVMLNISGEAKAGGGKKALRKVKGVARNLYYKLKGEQQ
jgi:hypothetical protein